MLILTAGSGFGSAAASLLLLLAAVGACAGNVAPCVATSRAHAITVGAAAAARARSVLHLSRMPSGGKPSRSGKSQSSGGEMETAAVEEVERGAEECGTAQAKRKKKSGQATSKGPKGGAAARTKGKGRAAPHWTKLDEEVGSRDQSRRTSEESDNGDGEEAAEPTRVRAIGEQQKLPPLTLEFD